MTWCGCWPTCPGHGPKKPVTSHNVPPSNPDSMASYYSER